MRNLRKILISSAMMLTVSIVPSFASAFLSQPSPVPGTNVYDSTGKFVGKLISDTFQGYLNNGISAIEREINGIWVVLQGVQEESFYDLGYNIPAAVYTTNNCSGTTYYLGDSLPVTAFFVATSPVSGKHYYGYCTIYFPGKPQILITVMSKSIGSGSSFQCFPTSVGKGTFYVGPLQSIKANFTPPFTVQ